MNDLKKLLQNIYHQTGFGIGVEHTQTSEEVRYLYKSRYGKFNLTDAIRPGQKLEVIPTQGFRHEISKDEYASNGIKTLIASVSKELLFDTFLNLMEPMGDVVDVVLESSHDMPEVEGGGEMYRESIDIPVLMSILYHYEDLLLNDGCTGIAVLNPQLQTEVQFDEHKLLVVYASQLTPFESILIDSYVDCNECMKVITESEHVHCSSNRYAEQFAQLRYELGID